MEYALAVAVRFIDIHYEGDFVDRINHEFTPTVFVLCATVIFAKLAVGSSIECFTKAQYTKHWSAYTHDYCLVENTYYVPQNSSIPGFVERGEAQLSYYQWCGFILVGLALFSMLPHILWRSFNWISGYHIRPIIEQCEKAANGATSEQPEVVRKTAHMLLHASRLDHRYFHVFPRNTFTTYLYLLMKLSVLAVIFLQLKIVAVFLGSFTYPFQVLRYDLGDWQSSGLFPRVTLCDIDIRVPGQFQKYTMECTLPLNMLNEKIFVFLFFYLLTLAFFTVFNVLYWIVLIFRSGAFFKQLGECQEFDRGVTAKSQEKMAFLDENEDLSFDPIEEFARRVPGTDLTVVLHLLAKRVGFYFTSDVLLKMVKIDSDERMKRQGEASKEKSKPNQYLEI
ncbi:hypothetical protein L596_008118 [Steinernema carpocapsae]|uniref:Innexin n=1 Tax=Steinernema carpocapsae TaxID=34508 RepID=A0A4U5PBK2_STECR|nr:hypothetical protein L596_008118 [Steinernema carpocapsae]